MRRDANGVYFSVVTTSLFRCLKNGGLTKLSAQSILGGSDSLNNERECSMRYGVTNIHRSRGSKRMARTQ